MLYKILAHAPQQHLQEKCSIVFRGDTRDVLILRLTHLALHGPNCSASLSLSVQVICGIHITGWFELMMMMTEVMNKIIKPRRQDNTVPGGLRAVSRFCSPLQSHPSSKLDQLKTKPSKNFLSNPELPLLNIQPKPIDQLPISDHNGQPSSDQVVTLSTTPNSNLKDGLNEFKNASNAFMSFPITINSTLVFLDFKTSRQAEDSFDGAFSFHNTISRGSPHPNTWCDLTIRGDAFPFLPKLVGRLSGPSTSPLLWGLEGPLGCTTSLIPGPAQSLILTLQSRYQGSTQSPMYSSFLD